MYNRPEILSYIVLISVAIMNICTHSYCVYSKLKSFMRNKLKLISLGCV